MTDLDKPFSGSLAVAGGLLTKRALRGGRFVRLFPDVYVRSDVSTSLAIRSHAARLYIGDSAVLSGYSAAYFLIADCIPFGADAEVTTLRHVRPQPGLLVRREQLPDDEIVEVLGMPVTSPARTAYDLARRLSLIDGVATADALARAGEFTSADLSEIVRRHKGARWSRRIRGCVDLLDPVAESMMESRLRVNIVIRGLPRPVCQYSVFDDDGAFIARLDMAYPWAKVAVEYDGKHHRERAAQARDLRKHNKLLALGWKVLRYSAEDMSHPDRIAAEVSVALQAAAIVA